MSDFVPRSASHPSLHLVPLEPQNTRLLHGEPEQRDFATQWAHWLMSLESFESLKSTSESVLFLEGELGTGKTTFSSGLLAALDFEGVVSSPTYSLIHPYPTPHGRVLHIDAYRVEHASELYEMGLEELIEDSILCLVEWGQTLYDDYATAPILRFEHMADPQVRRVSRLR